MPVARHCLDSFLSRSSCATVIEDQGQILKAVHEGMRWLSPIWTTIGRRPTSDFAIGGVVLQAGQNVLLSYGSANRDEAQFEQPELFIMDRSSRSHLAFGTGKHICAGTYFAPQVARIALEELLSAHSID